MYAAESAKLSGIEDISYAQLYEAVPEELGNVALVGHLTTLRPPPWQVNRVPMVEEGKVVGFVERVGQTMGARRAEHIWSADVNVGSRTVSIVWGGLPIVKPGCLVPVALPGARLENGKKVRARNWRDARSEGMLLSPAEAGWNPNVTDQVALLFDGKPGQSLDGTMVDIDSGIYLSVKYPPEQKQHNLRGTGVASLQIIAGEYGGPRMVATTFFRTSPSLAPVLQIIAATTADMPQEVL